MPRLVEFLLHPVPLTGHWRRLFPCGEFRRFVSPCFQARCSWRGAQFSGLNTVVDVSICRNFLRIDNKPSIAEFSRVLNLFRGRWMLINYLFSVAYVWLCRSQHTLLATQFGREIRSFFSRKSAFPTSAEAFPTSAE